MSTGVGTAQAEGDHLPDAGTVGSLSGPLLLPPASGPERDGRPGARPLHGLPAAPRHRTGGEAAGGDAVVEREPAGGGYRPLCSQPVRIAPFRRLHPVRAGRV
ncbi:hypothetical protein JCM4914_34890 [Streptomyces platensis subsp. malvinus]